MDMLSILDSTLLEWRALRPYGTYYTSALPSLVVGCGAAVVLGLLARDLWRSRAGRTSMRLLCITAGAATVVEGGALLLFRALADSWPWSGSDDEVVTAFALPCLLACGYAVLSAGGGICRASGAFASPPGSRGWLSRVASALLGIGLAVMGILHFLVLEEIYLLTMVTTVQPPFFHVGHTSRARLTMAYTDGSRCKPTDETCRELLWDDWKILSDGADLAASAPRTFALRVRARRSWLRTERALTVEAGLPRSAPGFPLKAGNRWRYLARWRCTMTETKKVHRGKRRFELLVTPGPLVNGLRYHRLLEVDKDRGPDNPISAVQIFALGGKSYFVDEHRRVRPLVTPRPGGGRACRLEFRNVQGVCRGPSRVGLAGVVSWTETSSVGKVNQILTGVFTLGLVQPDLRECTTRVALVNTTAAASP